MRNSKLLTVIILSALLTGSGCSLPGSSSKEIVKFEWMTGSRADTVSGFYEYWSVQGDSALVGKGYRIAAGDTIFSEKLMITKYNGKWAYIVNFRNEETRFILVNKPGDSLVFDNPENAFPKRITYVKKVNGLIAASIDNPDEPGKITGYNFIPVK